MSWGEVVAAELTRRVEQLCGDLTRRAVHALGISPLTSAQIMVDRNEVLHLVARRVPNEDAIGEKLHTACGRALWSDLETPQLAGMRGNWQTPEPYRVARCRGCAEHAATRERPGDANLPSAVGDRIGAAVASRVRPQHSASRDAASST